MRQISGFHVVIAVLSLVFLAYFYFSGFQKSGLPSFSTYLWYQFEFGKLSVNQLLFWSSVLSPLLLMFPSFWENLFSFLKRPGSREPLLEIGTIIGLGYLFLFVFVLLTFPGVRDGIQPPRTRGPLASEAVR